MTDASAAEIMHLLQYELLDRGKVVLRLLEDPSNLQVGREPKSKARACQLHFNSEAEPFNDRTIKTFPKLSDIIWNDQCLI